MIKATRKVIPPEPFSSLGEAYELPDGTIAFTNRGASVALSPGSGGKSKFESYACGMLAETGSGELEIVEFVLPDGRSIARGPTLDALVDVISWYADKYVADVLKPQQRHIGRAAARLNAAAARLGWHTIARSWFGRTIQAEEVPVLHSQLILRERTRWTQFYDWQIAEALAKYFNVSLPIDRTRGWPSFMANPVHPDLYRILLGEELYVGARAARDDLGNETIHQGLHENLKDSIREHFPTLVTLAEGIDSSYRDWKIAVAKVIRARRGDETPFGQLRTGPALSLANCMEQKELPGV